MLKQGVKMQEEIKQTIDKRKKNSLLILNNLKNRKNNN